MGFAMEVSILRPSVWFLDDAERKARGTATVWWPEAIMRGYASWPGSGRDMPKGHALAELCTTSWLLSKLLETSKKLERRLFAPPFAPLEDIRSKLGVRQVFISPYSWQLENEQTFSPRTHVLMPWWNDSIELGMPGEDKRRKHNEVLFLSRRSFAR